MTWYTKFNDNFTRANASSLGNNWVDANSQASIVSNQANFVANSSSPWSTGLVLRPTGENLLDQRAVMTIPVNGLNSTAEGAYVGLRCQSAGNLYFVGTATASVIKIYKSISGTLSALSGSIAISPALNAAHSYTLDAQATGASPTTIAFTLTDVTTSTVVATGSITDSTSALQAAGQSGLFFNSSGVTKVSNFTTYTDIALVAGTASTTSSGNTIATVTVGAATGGTSPYTYQWYRSTTNGFTPGGGNIVSGATSQTLNDTGLTNGTTYYYVNVATDAGSNTAQSNQISATPSSVSGLSAGTASTTSTGSTVATVTVASATGGTAPYTYQWYRSTTNGFTPGAGNIVSGATSQTLNDTGLTNSTTYYYVNVVTDSASGTAQSNQTSATPAALAAGTASTTSSGNTVATVTVGNATGGSSPYSYQWYRSTTSGFTPGGGNLVSGATSQTLNDTGLTNNTTYYYANIVTDSASNTSTSNQTSATPTGVQSGTATTLVNGNATVSVGVATASGGSPPYTYQWYRSTTSGFTPGSGNIISGATSQNYKDTGLTNGTTYYYVNVVTDSASATGSSSQITGSPATTNNIVYPDSTAFVFSPGNWKGDNGRAGNVYRQSWNNGAYFRLRITCGASPTCTILLPTLSGDQVDVAYYINGKLINSSVGATGNLALTGLTANATNDIFLIAISNSTVSGRWNNGGNDLQILGAKLDTASSAGVAPVYSKWVMLIGDSISEGAFANAGTNSFIYGFSHLVGWEFLAQGYDFCASTCGYSGWLYQGDSGQDVPAYYYVSGGVYNASLSRWNLIDAGVSILDTNGQISAYGSTGTTPAAIYVNYGTNDVIYSTSVSDMTTSVTGWLNALKTAAPTTKVIVGIPFSMDNTALYSTGPTYVAAIKAGANASTNGNMTIADNGVNLSNLLNSTNFTQGGGPHPLLIGSAYIAPMVLEQMQAALAPAVPAQIYYRVGH